MTKGKPEGGRADTALCLNMIVKNEMANLERCLSAVAGYIDCWVIGDTGSSDGTQDFVIAFFAERGLPGELHSFPFHNFEQARNAALDHVYASPLQYDYLLFADADMELVVEDPAFRAGLTATGYRLLQRTAGGLSYWNTRLVRRDAGARYKGVTHEYVDVAGEVEQLHAIWYKDHASGSNRTDKFERDIRLLTAALQQDPDDRRYWFYLAQSYKDAGRLGEAVETYAKRAAMGGWEEEAWYAQMTEARCRRDLGDEAGFLRQAVAAFNRRPTRAEPLYDLAKYYRERSMNEASVLFSEAGLAIARPQDDVLFLEDFVYTVGLKEEYSIAANYARDPARKKRGHQACNWLALSREASPAQRDLARSNLYFYLDPVAAMLPSFAAQPVSFTPPDGYHAMNPSVTRRGDEIALAQRCVNYVLTDGRYETADGAPIHTRNFLLRLDEALEVRSSAEILPPADLPAASYELVRGFEDVRLFAWRGELWGVATARELTREGWCEQVLSRIEDTAAGLCRLTDWRLLHPPGPRLHEKNWMPLVAGDSLSFVYLCDPTRIVDEQARQVAETTPAIAAEQFSGGSQVIAFDQGWLALVHEARARPGSAQRYYQHRFVWFDAAITLRRVSRAFFFHEKDGVEFASGLAWHPDARRLLLSYGVGDRESWLATVQSDDIRRVLDDAEQLPWGLPTPSVTAAKPVEEKPVERDPAPPTVISPKPRSSEEVFRELAPFLAAVDSPAERRRRSCEFDARIAPLLDGADTLPQIHCFYEVLSDTAQHQSLVAATASMRAAGHPVRVWSYAPQRLEFLRPHGVELRQADDIVPKGLFERVVAGSEIRYFSDIFRYAALYENGGLWMDTDVVMLRPFPFRGDHFLNLQWGGAHQGHFVCGNVMYAKPFSRHMRNLYETAIERFFASNSKTFGDIGPKLLSDYVASDAGAELRQSLFSPVFFNPIDWTELDRFNQPIGELADYLHDERVFGIHLWNAKTNALSREEGASLIALLSDPIARFPSLTDLADRFDTDKNRHTGNRHCYARVYDRLLSSRRFSLRRLMEIGLCRGLAERNQPNAPSVELWQNFFPFCHVLGVDLTDFSRFDNGRFSSFVCDQSKPEELRSVAARIEPGSLDVIIDDGSHASYDQQLTLREFFPLLAEGGWYFIEDLDWQPPGEDPCQITQTKQLLREIQQNGGARSTDPLGITEYVSQMSDVLLFDSHYELQRANLLGGLAAIRKRAGARVDG